MNFEKSEFLKLLESKEVPLEKLSKVLCRGISCTNIETVREFVLKYEVENGAILLHQWKEIFEALGYAEDFSGVVGHVVGQPHRHHGSPKQFSSSDHYNGLSSGDGAIEDLDTESSSAPSQPEASSVRTDNITRTTNPHTLGALDQRSGAIPKKRAIPQKHVEPDGKSEPSCAPCFDQVSVNGLHVDEDDSCVGDQMNVPADAAEMRQAGCPLMTPSLGLPEPEKVHGEQHSTVCDHSVASVTVATGDASGQNSGQERATDDETSSMENNFDLQQTSVEAVKGEVSEKPSAAPLRSTCLPVAKQTCQVGGSNINAEPDHDSTPFATGGGDESGYFSLQNRDTDMRASNGQLPSLPSVNNLENEMASITKEEDQCQQTYTASLRADSCQVQQPPTRLINDSTAVTSSTAEAVPSLPRESMLVTGHGNNSGLQSQETGNPSEHYDTTENACICSVHLNGHVVQDLLQRRIDRLESNVVFLSEELEERTIALNNHEVYTSRLQRELLDCRAQCASLEEQKQELIQIHQENHQMIAQTNQMLQWKQEECNRLDEVLQGKQEECSRLEEHIRQSEVQYNNAITDMSAQRRALEASEMSLELRREVQLLHEEHGQFLLQERERLRIQNARILDAKLEEVCLAYHNAETDEVKELKEKLSKEEESRKKTEEINKQLCQEVEHLRTLLRQCSPHPDCGAATYSENVGSSEDEFSNASTTEVEIDNAAESARSIQQSETQAPDECSDETRSSLKVPQRK